MLKATQEKNKPTATAEKNKPTDVTIPESLEDLDRDQLRLIARDKNISQAGHKDELVQRLRAHAETERKLESFLLGEFKRSRELNGMLQESDDEDVSVMEIGTGNLTAAARNKR